MTGIEVAGPASSVPLVAPPVAAPHGVGIARFLGSERAFFGLLARGAVFLMLTLGIYRFWLATDVRRFLWGNTDVAGDTLEYTGTARELFIGFLMALALLTPIYALFFIAALELGAISALSGALSFVLLALLGQFAVFRARRYRLTRTIFRGVRLHQTGSAWAYAFLSMLWMGLTILTAGLAHPWSVAVLERYKLRHTHYGTLDGRFEGSGTRLFFRGFLMWLLVALPFAAGVVLGVLTIDWAGLVTLLMEGSEDIWSRAIGMAPDLIGALLLASGGIGWAVIAALLLYPVYRAMVLRWWVNGVRLGSMTAASRLRTGQIYRVYLRFLGYSLLFAIAAGMLSGAGLVAIGSLSESFGQSVSSEIAGSVIAIGGYVFVMLGYSTIYQATVTIRFWRLTFETTQLSGLAALDAVEARGGPSSPFGEGLADALDVGGL